jgi:hypothetical protein
MGFAIEKDWATKAGLRAACLFVNDSHRCGYVGVPKGHPLFGVEYNESTPLLADAMKRAKGEPLGKRGMISLLCCEPGEDGSAKPEIVFDVHGSLTFSGGGDKYPVVDSGLWWFGFDCAHLGDATKYLDDGLFRSLDYVERECESLAAQIVAVFQNPMPV